MQYVISTKKCKQKMETQELFFICIYLGDSSEHLLQNGIGLGFLWSIGLYLETQGTWSGNKPTKNLKKTISEYSHSGYCIIIIN
jgi:hypothetical protein